MISSSLQDDCPLQMQFDLQESNTHELSFFRNRFFKDVLPTRDFEDHKAFDTCLRYLPQCFKIAWTFALFQKYEAMTIAAAPFPK